jgi:galactokinase
LNASLPVHDPPLRLLVAFQQAFPDHSPEWIIRAPGRDMWIAAVRAGSAQFTVAAPDLGGRATFSLQSAKSRLTVTRRPLPRWARYPAGVTILLDQEGLDVTGLNMVFAGEEPPGPRFDYALGMAFATLWHELHQQPYTVDDLIEIVDRARREYVEEPGA